MGSKWSDEAVISFNNLIREDGLIVTDVEKIKCADSSNYNEMYQIEVYNKNTYVELNYIFA